VMGSDEMITARLSFGLEIEMMLRELG